MATGWLTWTCLLLAGSTGGEDVFYMNQRGFQIPIRIQEERQQEVKEVILYVSSNKGVNWAINSRADPRKNQAFDFWADQDGIYYFNVATVDARGKQDPQDIYKVPAGMKVCVDTIKPDVRLLSLDRAGEEISVTWEARDERAEWTSFRVEWRAADNPSGTWTPLGVQPSEKGSHRFRVNVPGDVHVRVKLRDLAGNEGSDERVAPGVAMRHDPAMLRTRSDDLPPPSGMIPPPTTTSSLPLPATNVASSSTPAIPAPDQTSFPPVSPPSNPPSYEPQPITTSNAAPSPTTAYATPTRGQLPPLTIVNKQQAKLGFNVDRIGPSGLGSVDVYVSTDEGATWEKSLGDHALSLPVGIDGLNGSPLQGSVSVHLPKEGVVYGFYIVLKSRAGLGKQPPAAGTVPQIRLECDTTPPSADLYAPQPDPGRSSSLVLMWKAEDRNLTTNPITLEWSASPTGPWEAIGERELPNTGRYVWNVSSKIPPRVYLKLSARDSAGNVAVAQTAEPVLIDLTVPEIGGVQVISGR